MGQPHRGGRRPRPSPAVYRRRRLVAVVAAFAVVVLLVMGVQRLVGVLRPEPTSYDVGASGPAASPSATARPTATPTTGAGVRRTVAVRQEGTGRLVPVAGDVPAPGGGSVTSVRVEVEEGVEVDRAEFARQVLATLNDPRSWGHGGRMSFARTDGAADVRVVLASPETSARLCRPLRTMGTLSCSVGDRAILTSYRWTNATPEFADLTVYRQYVVNHEVGHALGHGHDTCPGSGKRAPVMQQQTIRVAPCTPNAWPFP